MVVVVSFLLEVAIGCSWSKSLLCKLQFFHSGFSFTLRIVRLNPSQVFYWFGFSGLSYCCVFYFLHFTIISYMCVNLDLIISLSNHLTN